MIYQDDSVHLFKSMTHLEEAITELELFKQTNPEMDERLHWLQEHIRSEWIRVNTMVAEAHDLRLSAMGA